MYLKLMLNQVLVSIPCPPLTASAWCVMYMYLTMSTTLTLMDCICIGIWTLSTFALLQNRSHWLRRQRGAIRFTSCLPLLQRSAIRFTSYLPLLLLRDVTWCTIFDNADGLYRYLDCKDSTAPSVLHLTYRFCSAARSVLHLTYRFYFCVMWCTVFDNAYGLYRYLDCTISAFA